MPTEREVFDRALTHQERLDADAFAKEILVLGFLHFYKFDIILAWEERNPNKNLPLDDVQRIADSFTDRQLADYHKFAENTLREYTQRHHNDGSFWRGVWQSVAGAFVYSLLLLIAFIAAKASGADLISVLRELVRP